MKLETTRFGTIEVNSDEIFVFPEGPLGFPECTRFVFIDEEGVKPFRMMQSIDKPSLAFVVMDPLAARPDYTFRVTKEDLNLIKAKDTKGLIVYVIVTMAKELKDVTVNLQGPLIINPATKLVHQFVLTDEEYTTRESILLDQMQEENSQTKKDNPILATKAG